jgi:hypothetical protein
MLAATIKPLKMKYIFLLILFLPCNFMIAQKIYKTSGGEFIFSRSVNNSPFLNASTKVRVSAFFHYNDNYHFNIADNFGLYSGFSVSNIGFIYKLNDTTFKKRAYTLGIPLAFKFGNLPNENYLFAGGELEFPFHYKQKMIIGDEKDKYSGFFDKRVNPVLPSVFAGIQFSSGFCFKIRVFLNDFLNKNFTGNDFGSVMSYKNTSSKIFLLSLSYNLKENKIKKIIKNEERYANLII